MIESNIDNKQTEEAPIGASTVNIPQEEQVLLEANTNPPPTLYSELSKHADMGTEEEFMNTVKDPASRNDLYRELSSHFDVGSYDDFSRTVLDTPDEGFVEGDFGYTDSGFRKFHKDGTPFMSSSDYITTGEEYRKESDPDYNYMAETKGLEAAEEYWKDREMETTTVHSPESSESFNFLTGLLNEEAKETGMSMTELMETKKNEYEEFFLSDQDLGLRGRIKDMSDSKATIAKLTERMENGEGASTDPEMLALEEEWLKDAQKEYAKARHSAYKGGNEDINSYGKVLKSGIADRATMQKAIEAVHGDLSPDEYLERFGEVFTGSEDQTYSLKGGFEQYKPIIEEALGKAMDSRKGFLKDDSDKVEEAIDDMAVFLGDGYRKMVPQGLSDRGKAEFYYTLMLKEWEERMDREEEYAEENGMAGVVARDFAMMPDAEITRRRELERRLKAFAPIYYLNENPFETTESGFFGGVADFTGSSIKGGLKEMVPWLQGEAGMMDKAEKMAEYVDFAKQSGALDLVQGEGKERLEERYDTKTGEGKDVGTLTDMYFYSNAVGQSIPLMIDLAVGSHGAKSAMGLTKWGKGFMKVAEDPRLMNRFLRMKNTYDKSSLLGKLYNPKNASRVARHLTGATQTAINYQTAGILFPGKMDEMNALTGAFGYGGVAAIGKLSKSLPKFRGMTSSLSSVLGADTDKATNLLVKLGKTLKTRAGAGVGEAVEETSQQLSQVLMKSEGFSGMWDELEKNFGNLDNTMKTVVASFIMGSLMGGSAISEASLNKVDKALINMDKDNQAIFRDIVNELKTESDKDIQSKIDLVLKGQDLDKDIPMVDPKGIKTETEEKGEGIGIPVYGKDGNVLVGEDGMPVVENVDPSLEGSEKAPGIEDQKRKIADDALEGIIDHETGRKEVVKPKKEKIDADIKNKNFTTFEYKKEEDVPDILKEYISSKGSNKEGVFSKEKGVVRVTVPTSVAEYMVYRSTPNAKPETIHLTDVSQKTIDRTEESDAEYNAKIEEEFNMLFDDDVEEEYIAEGEGNIEEGNKPPLTEEEAEANQAGLQAKIDEALKQGEEAKEKSEVTIKEVKGKKAKSKKETIEKSEGTTPNTYSEPLVETSEDGASLAKTMMGEAYEIKGGIGLVKGFGKTSRKPAYAPYIKGKGHMNKDIETPSVKKGLLKVISEDDYNRMVALKNSLESEENSKQGDPFKTQKSNVAVMDNVDPEVTGLVKGILKGLGLDTKVLLLTDKDLDKKQYDKHGIYGNLSQVRSAKESAINDGGHGAAQKMTDAGANYIYYSDKLSTAEKMSIVSHELGHIIEKEVFNNSSKEVKDAVISEYNEWIGGINKDKGRKLKDIEKESRDVLIHKLIENDKGDRVIDGSNPYDSYLTSFPEWFADNVAKWVRSSEKPKTIVDKFFSEIANKLKKIYSYVFDTGHYSESIFDWLDGMYDSSRVADMIAEDGSLLKSKMDKGKGDTTKAKAIIHNNASNMDPKAVSDNTSTLKSNDQQQDINETFETEKTKAGENTGKTGDDLKKDPLADDSVDSDRQLEALAEEKRVNLVINKGVGFLSNIVPDWAKKIANKGKDKLTVRGKYRGEYKSLFQSTKDAEFGKNAELHEVNVMVDQLNNLKKKYEKDGRAKEWGDVDNEYLDDYLRGGNSGEDLDEELKTLADEMIEKVIGYEQTLVDLGILKEHKAISLQTVNDETGESKKLYLATTYANHHNRDWIVEVKKNQPELIQDAVDMLRRQDEEGGWLKRFEDPKKELKRIKRKAKKLKTDVTDAEVKKIADTYRRDFKPLTDEELEGVVLSMLSKHAARYARDIGNASKVQKMKTQNLKKKKDLSPEIAALYGAVKDPIFNYSNTVASQAMMIQRAKMFRKWEAEGQDAGFVSDTPKGRTVRQVNGAGYGALNGKYVTDELELILTEMTALDNKTNATSVFQSINSSAKMLMTVLNPSSNINNIVGAGFVSLTNGHFNMVGSNAATAWSYIRRELAKDNSDALKRLIELGVTGGGAESKEFQIVMKSIKDSPSMHKAVDNIQNELMKTIVKGGAEGLKSGAELAGRVYKAGDDFFRVIGYLNEYQSRLRDYDSYRELAAEHGDVKAKELFKKTEDHAALEKEAAKVVNAVYPSHAYLPDIVNNLRKIPLFGTFYSYHIEAMRTGVNTVRLASRELAGKDIDGKIITDPEKNLRAKKRGAKRLASALAVQGLFYGAEVFSAAMFMSGYDDEDLKEAMPDYDRDSSKIYLTPDEDGNPRYISLGSKNPYGGTMVPAAWSLIHLLSGDTKKAVHSGSDMMEPFLAESFIGEKVLDIYLAITGRDNSGKVINPEDTGMRQVTDGAMHFMSMFNTGLIKTGGNIYDAAVGNKDSFNKEKEVSSELFGVLGTKAKVLEIDKSLSFKGAKIKKRIAMAKKIFDKYDYNADTEDKEKYVDRVNVAMKDISEEARKLMKTWVNLGKTPEEVYELMRKGDGNIAPKFSSEDIETLMNGEDIKYKLNEAEDGMDKDHGDEDLDESTNW